MIIFDMLILHPRPPSCRDSVNAIVRHRLHLFKQGHLSVLYDAALLAPPPTTTTTPPAYDVAAQLAADEDNYHTAYARITQAMSVAKMTEEAQAICQKLYPPPTSYQSHHRPTRHHTPATLHVCKETLHRALIRLRKGTAAGPFGDLPDTLRAFALYQPPHSTTKPYFDRFASFLSLVINNQVPSSIVPHIAASHFMALHKDPADPAKLRPISIGSAI
ncbi:MAG: hypothetical protein ACRCYW_13585 [Aeromonas sp.]|uniref:hypothetical protein n=1 Tax=Aeromonas sp. TaxID=647 RepID=UPI003F3D5D71